LTGSNRTIDLQDATKLMWIRPSVLRQYDNDIDTAYLTYRVTLFVHEPVHGLIVFIDAMSENGQIVFEVKVGSELLVRKVYAPTYSNIVWKEGSTFPTSNSMYNDLILTAREVYNCYASLTSGKWLSYNGSSSVMNMWLNTQNLDTNFDYSCAVSPNAFWDGIGYTHFCPNMVIDDVIAHEWSHAYTQYTNGLIYSYQAGALNEGYSDVWGELIDLLNGRDLDSPGIARTQNEGTGSIGCDVGSSWRWKVGEGSSGFPAGLRDMWQPECMQAPGKMSSLYYECGADDSGGVHTNSGVLNHFFALLVDGGTYNGQTIVGIGMHRAAHIMWRTQSVYLVGMSTYQLFSVAAYQSCLDLMGTTLPMVNLSDPDPRTGTWGGTVTPLTSDHCNQVAQTSVALEISSRPPCATTYVQGQNTPPLCSIRSYVLYEDFESGNDITSTGWSWSVDYQTSYPSTWLTRAWYITPSLPGGRSGRAARGPTPNFDCYNLDGTDLSADQSGIIYMRSKTFTAPPGTTNLKMAFWTYFSLVGHHIPFHHLILDN
jgi:bacillolysin